MITFFRIILRIVSNSAHDKVFFILSKKGFKKGWGKDFLQKGGPFVGPARPPGPTLKKDKQLDRGNGDKRAEWGSFN
jgi:hypothetical protein